MTVNTKTTIPATAVPEYFTFLSEYDSGDQEAATKAATDTYLLLKSRLESSVQSGSFSAILKKVSIELGANATTTAELNQTVTVGTVEICIRPALLRKIAMIRSYCQCWVQLVGLSFS